MRQNLLTENRVSRFLLCALREILLGVIGTLALLLVSGGIFAHNVSFLHNPFPWMPGLVYEFVLGLLTGLVLLFLIQQIKKLLGRQ